MGDELIDHKVRAMDCPSCGSTNDGALSTDTEHVAPPRPGDISVCAYCAMVSVFEDDRLRPITDHEYRQTIRDEPMLLRAVEAIRRHPDFGKHR